MAVLVKNKVVKNVGTSNVSIVETTPSNRITIIGLSLTNLIGTFVNVSVLIEDENFSTGYYLKDTMLPSNTSLRAVSTGEKLVLSPNNKLFVKSTLSNSIDVIVSYVETE